MLVCLVGIFSAVCVVCVCVLSSFFCVYICSCVRLIAYCLLWPAGPFSMSYGVRRTWLIVVCGACRMFCSLPLAVRKRSFFYGSFCVVAVIYSGGTVTGPPLALALRFRTVVLKNPICFGSTRSVLWLNHSERKSKYRSTTVRGLIGPGGVFFSSAGCWVGVVHVCKDL